MKNKLTESMTLADIMKLPKDRQETALGQMIKIQNKKKANNVMTQLSKYDIATVPDMVDLDTTHFNEVYRLIVDGISSIEPKTPDFQFIMTLMDNYKIAKAMRKYNEIHDKYSETDDESEDIMDRGERVDLDVNKLKSRSKKPEQDDFSKYKDTLSQYQSESLINNANAYLTYLR